MSMIKQILSKIGIGAIKVNTKFDSERLVPGSEVQGVVTLQGGNVEQYINSIHIDLVSDYIVEFKGTKAKRKDIIKHYQLGDSIPVSPGERKELNFSFSLPEETPVTIKDTAVWFKTRLDIRGGINLQDKDYLQIEPTEITNSFLNIMQELGFQLKYVGNEYNAYHLSDKLPFIQEFQFVPSDGEFKKKVEKIECVFVPESSSQIDVIMGIERKTKGIGELMSKSLDTEENRTKLSVHHEQLENLEGIVRETINKAL